MTTNNREQKEELKEIMEAIQKSNLEQNFQAIAIDAVLRRYPPSVANELMHDIQQ